MTRRAMVDLVDEDTRRAILLERLLTRLEVEDVRTHAHIVRDAVTANA